MRVLAVALYPVILATAAALAGCGAPIVIAPPAGTALGDAAHRDGRQWMEAGLGTQTLLYVSNANGVVSVYNYSTRELVGTLTKFKHPAGSCADKAGDVYITDWQAQTISEYAHGGKKPINVISDLYYPYACSVDRTTGDLAVANFTPASSQQSYTSVAKPYDEGNVAVYAHGERKPKYYGSGLFSACAYDDRGDLLASSYSITSGFPYDIVDFYYLPKKSKSFVGVVLAQPSTDSYWEVVTGLAYDGKYWVVDDSVYLYRYTINVKAEYVDTIHLSGGPVGGIAAYRNPAKARATQIVSTIGYGTFKSDVGYWNYPVGGDPYYEIRNGLDNPNGFAISLGHPQ